VLLHRQQIELNSAAFTERNNAMIDQNVENAKAQQGAIEALIKGLPGIRDYIDKELRRSADRRLRDELVNYLQTQRIALVQHQQTLLERQGLKWIAKVDANVRRLQTLIDRIQTASYGYAGFFSDIRIREEELNALYRFDQALTQEAQAIGTAVDTVGAAADDAALATALEQLNQTIVAVDQRFAKRESVITAPELLTDSEAA
jgi:hypothetical protein